MGLELAVAGAAIMAGGIASLTGFGIGSVLTPLLALRVGTKLAVAAVSIPHAIGTAMRFWLLCGHIDRRIFMWFGVASAAGGLAGALLHAHASNRALAGVFGCLLLFVGAWRSDSSWMPLACRSTLWSNERHCSRFGR